MPSAAKAKTIKKTFSRETEVKIDISASPEVIWKLLTNAADYPRWNSTVVSIEGTIKEGENIALKSILDPKRIFQLKVKEMVTNKKMIWGDGQGDRIYTLKRVNDHQTRFSMNEKIGGFMFPLYGRFIPPFEESFEQFAADLKKEAESN